MLHELSEDWIGTNNWLARLEWQRHLTKGDLILTLYVQPLLTETGNKKVSGWVGGVGTKAIPPALPDREQSWVQPDTYLLRSPIVLCGTYFQESACRISA